MKQPIFTQRRSLEARPSGSTQSRCKRPGVAAVEMAVCLPVIILLVFGTIEASGLIFLKQALNVAAYEGVRESIRVGSSNADGAEIAMAILSSRKIKDVQIRFPNGEAYQANRGDEIVMEVSASKNSNSKLLGHLGTNQLLTTRVVMLKE